MSVDPNRIHRESSAEERERLHRNRAAVAAELPELVERDRMRKEAHDESTLSGELRRAIHRSEQSLEIIASRAGLTALQLDEFLTGERTLRSDVLDRIAAALDFRFQKVS